MGSNPTTTPATTASKLPNAPIPGAGSVKELRAGDSLVFNQRLTSPNGKHWLALGMGGKLQLWNSDVVVWESEEDLFLDERGSYSVTLRPTGELVVLKVKSAIWISDTYLYGTTTQGAVLIVQDDGHAAILSNGERVWYTYRQKDGSTDKARLVAGEWLAAGQALISPSGKLTLALQPNGDFVLSKAGQKLWGTTAVSATSAADARVTLRDDDNLWIGSAVSPVWTSKTRRKRNGGNAVLRIAEAGDGGAAFLESDGVILWSTKPSSIQAWEPQKPVPADPKSDRVLSGQYLPLKQDLPSANGEFAAFIQPDGIYIQRYEDDSGVLWSLKPNSKVSSSRLSLGLDGNLVLAGPDSSVVWESKTASLVGQSTLLMQNDGNLVLSGSNVVYWSSGSVFPAIKGQIDKLNGGESLLLDQNLVSKNGLWSLRFTTEAYFAIQNTKTMSSTLYYTCPLQQNAKILTLSTSGNLEIRGSPDRQLKWSSANQKAVTSTAAIVDPKSIQFVMQDNGNAVLSIGGSKALSTGGPTARDAVTVVWDAWSRPRGSWPTKVSDRLGSNTINSNAMLTLGQGIISPSGEFCLWLKPDGDLELNSKNGRRLWNSGSAGKPGVDSVFLNRVGTLIVYASKEKVSAWQSRDTSTYPEVLNAELVVQDSGNVAIMSSGNTFWKINAK